MEKIVSYKQLNKLYFELYLLNLIVQLCKSRIRGGETKVLKDIVTVLHVREDG